MKLYLDDVRQCPEGWVLARTYEEAKDLIYTGRVTHVSLDHDLGQDEDGKDLPSGYDLICWIEESLYYGFIPMMELSCHSDNPPGRRRIEQTIEAIRRRHGKR